MTAARRTAAHRAFHVAVLVVGCAGFASAWTLLAAGFGRPLSVLAVVAALDAAILLRLVGVRAGGLRAAAGVVLTAAIIAAAQWGVISGQVGAMLGLPPWESALRMGASLAWTLSGIAIGPVDLAWFGASLMVAAVLSR